MTVISIITAVIVLLILASFLLSDRGRGIADFFRLLSKGKKLGFSLSQVLFLSNVAKAVGLAEASDMLESPAALDACVAEIVKRAKADGLESGWETQNTLSLLYERRRKMDVESSRKAPGIASTREIRRGQPLLVVLTGAGAFSSKVMQNSRSCLTIDLPRAPSVMSTKLDWNNKPLKVFFWRSDDAGYVFQTAVIPRKRGDNRAVLQLKHSGKVSRFQMRKNTRAKCSIPAQLYMLKNDESDVEIEPETGMKCVLQDLSVTGARILAEGNVTRGMKIKIQFMLQDELIMMAGNVKSSDYKPAKGSSLIHFECTSIRPKMKNDVLAFVYSVLPETEEDNDGLAED